LAVSAESVISISRRGYRHGIRNIKAGEKRNRRKLACNSENNGEMKTAIAIIVSAYANEKRHAK